MPPNACQAWKCSETLTLRPEFPAPKVPLPLLATNMHLLCLGPLVLLCSVMQQERPPVCSTRNEFPGSHGSFRGCPSSPMDSAACSSFCTFQGLKRSGGALPTGWSPSVPCAHHESHVCLTNESPYTRVSPSGQRRDRRERGQTVFRSLLKWSQRSDLVFISPAGKSYRK